MPQIPLWKVRDFLEIQKVVEISSVKNELPNVKSGVAAKFGHQMRRLYLREG